MIPGSHLWDNNRAPKLSEIDYAVMQKGDAYVMLGSTYHAGGANKTETERRTLHGLFFSRGYLRSEVCHPSHLPQYKPTILPNHRSIELIRGNY